MHIPFSERPLCTAREGEEALGIKTSTLYRLIREGRIETVKIGSRTYLKVPSLLRLAEHGANPKAKHPPIRRGPRRRQHGNCEPPEAA